MLSRSEAVARRRLLLEALAQREPLEAPHHDVLSEPQRLRETAEVLKEGDEVRG